MVEYNAEKCVDYIRDRYGSGFDFELFSAAHKHKNSPIVKKLKRELPLFKGSCDRPVFKKLKEV